MSYNLELREGYHMITVYLNECDIHFDGLFRQQDNRKLFMVVRYNIQNDSIRSYKESHEVYQKRFDEIWDNFDPEKPNSFVFYSDDLWAAFHVATRLEYKQGQLDLESIKQA